MKVRNIFGTEFKGTIGKKLVAAEWKGIQYIRKYTVPTNPRTQLQVRHRLIFSKGVETWHDLLVAQQQFYNRLAGGMTGFNLFVKRWIEAHTAGLEEFQFPAVLLGTSEDVNQGTSRFTLRRASKTLCSFIDPSAEQLLQPTAIKKQ